MSLAEELLASLEEDVASHEHVMYDPDNYFVINPDTRQISSLSQTPNVVMQYDHNSEIYTFEIPRYVEGHDMLECDRVRLHYINVGQRSGQEYADVYEMTDLRVNPKDTGTLISTWTIKRQATQYPGRLNFVIQYLCIDDSVSTDEGTSNVSYEWHTDIYKDIEVRETIDNAEQSVIMYSDILENWYQQLFGTGDSVIAKIVEATEEQKEAIALKGEQTLATIPEDYTTTYKLANDALRTRAAAIVKSVEGESIVVNDASDDYLRGLHVYGKSSQVVTTGKQLLHNTATTYTAYGITFTTLPDGSISVSGTATGEAYYLFDNTNEIPVHETELIASMSGDSNVSMVIGYFTNLSTWEFVNNIATVNSNASKTLTFPSEAVATRTFLAVSSGKTVNTIIYPLLRLATVEDDTYEPYSGGMASPSPDWPQEITSVDTPTVSIYGKNLLPYPYAQSTASAYGVTFTVQDDGGIAVTGTATDATGIMIYTGNVLVDSGTITFSISGTYKNVTMQIALYDENSNDIITFQGRSVVTVNINDYPTAKTMRLLIKRLTNSAVSGVVYPQIELGSVATEYEQYQTKQTIAPAYTLPGIPVSSDGNYADSNGQQWICDEIDFERGVYVQRIFNETLTDFSGAINYSYDGQGTSCALAVGVQLVPTIGICSHLPLTTNTTGNNRFNPIDGVIYFKLDGEYAFEDLKAKLTEMSPVVIASFVTPIETPLTDEELFAFSQLHSNYLTTTVVNDVDAYMKIKYNADTRMSVYGFINDAIDTDEIQTAVDNWLNAHYASAEGVSF